VRGFTSRLMVLSYPGLLVQSMFHAMTQLTV
jgi:hypothetical protein